MSKIVSYHLFATYRPFDLSSKSASPPCRDLRAHQRECFVEAELLPGAEKLVRHLHSKGIPIAIATGSDKESYDIKISRHQEFMRLDLEYCLNTEQLPNEVYL